MHVAVAPAALIVAPARNTEALLSFVLLGHFFGQKIFVILSQSSARPLAMGADCGSIGKRGWGAMVVLVVIANSWCGCLQMSRIGDRGRGLPRLAPGHRDAPPPRRRAGPPPVGRRDRVRRLPRRSCRETREASPRRAPTDGLPLLPRRGRIPPSRPLPAPPPFRGSAEASPDADARRSYRGTASVPRPSLGGGNAAAPLRDPRPRRSRTHFSIFSSSPACLWGCVNREREGALPLTTPSSAQDPLQILVCTYVIIRQNRQHRQLVC